MQTFLCRQVDLLLLTLEYLLSNTLLSIVRRGRSKAFSLGPLPKIPAVVDICNQYRLVVCLLLAPLLKIFKSILVAGGEMARGEMNQCVCWAALPALLLPHVFFFYHTFSGRQRAPLTDDVIAPRPLLH